MSALGRRSHEAQDRRPSLPLSVRLAARLAGLTVVGLALIAAGVVLDLLAVPWASVSTLLGGLALVVGLVCTFVRPVPDVAPLVVDSPVAGRWEALNSPTSKVPSHGLHAYGQTFAIDLVHTPPDRPRPVFGEGGQMRPSTDYPAFGRPVLSPADATVVKTVDRYRDHRARSGTLALLYLMVEGAVRELGGPGPIVGNHVVLRTADGSHLLLAHLQRRSVRVHRGDRVRAGQLLGACGNSGNSSEPHLHLQRMDVARPLVAAGLPWALRGTGADSADGLPANGTSYEGRPARTATSTDAATADDQ